RQGVEGGRVEPKRHRARGLLPGRPRLCGRAGRGGGAGLHRYPPGGHHAHRRYDRRGHEDRDRGHRAYRRGGELTHLSILFQPRGTAMAQNTLSLLPGDGIGVEIMAEVVKLIDHLNASGKTDFTYDTGLVGGSAYDAHGVAIS